MKRAKRQPRLARLVRGVRELARFVRVDLDKGVQLVVEPGDAREVRVDDLPASALRAVQQRGLLEERQIGKFDSCSPGG